MKKLDKYCISCLPVVSILLMAFGGVSLAEEHCTQKAYLSFQEQASPILKILSLEGLSQEVSDDQRIALLYHPSTLNSAYYSFLSMNLQKSNSETLSPEDISKMVTMRFVPKTQLYEISVEAGSEIIAETLCKAILEAYVVQCEKKAQRELREVTQSVNQSISATLDALEEQKMHNSKKTQKDIRGEITVAAYEDILHRLIMAKAALLLGDHGMMTGWLPRTRILTVDAEQKQ